MTVKSLNELKNIISLHPNSPIKYIYSKKLYRDRRNIHPIKQYFNYRCQYCNYRLKTNSGKFYCHFAHIIPHNVSRDNTLENTLVLCSKHHTEFDNNIKKKRKILYKIKTKFPHINYPDIHTLLP